jgi:hypothetical protein
VKMAGHMLRKVSKEFATTSINVILKEAKMYFDAGDYKKSAKMYLQIAKFIDNWKLNVLGDVTDDTGRQKRERNNPVVGDETKQKPKAS